MSDAPTKIWWNTDEAAAYVRRGRRWLRKQVALGKLRAVQVGGKKEYLFRQEWLDQMLEEQFEVTPVLVPVRRRA